jgi:parallel beta-helix repeat protein
MKTQKLFLLALTMLLSVSIANAAVRYVKPEATGSGVSWEDAAGTILPTSLQDNDIIFLAAGTYTLTSNLAVNKSNVKIYGACAGTENEDEILAAIPDTTNYKTIIKYIGEAGTTGRVITANAGFLIQGCRITGGNLSGSNHGGGISLTTGTIKYCTIDGNTTAGNGGGIYCNGDNANVTIENCIIANNTANNGGGIHNSSTNATVLVKNCNISNNVATSAGGGVYLQGANTKLTDCTVQFNSVTNSSSTGGGVYANANSVIDRCIIDGNTSGLKGGGIHMAGAGTIRYCTVDNNKATTNGGGINCNSNSLTVTIENCIIANNTTGTQGGGVNLDGASTLIGCTVQFNSVTNTGSTGGGVYANTNSVIDRCIIDGNTSVGQGGGVLLNSQSTMTNSLVINNEANNTGAGVRVIAASDNNYTGTLVISMYNCTIANNKANTTTNTESGVSISAGTNKYYDIANIIVWGNTNQNDAVSGVTVNTNFRGIIKNSIFHEAASYDATDYGNDNLNSDPSFVDAANGNYRLQAGSPAIDAGDETDLSYNRDLDLDGNARINNTIDIGAYEYYFVIAPGASVSSTTYETRYGDIIFQSDDEHGAGQLTGIGSEGLTVNGVVKLEKTFTVKKWYPIGFPFAIESIKGEFEEEEDLVIYNSDEKTGDFWLQSYDGEKDEFGYSSTLAANIGYAIQFPNDFEDVKVTFISAENPVLYNTTESDIELANDSYTLIANPSVGNVSTITEAGRYYQYGADRENNFGLLDEEATMTLKPFESVVVTKNVQETLRSSLGTGAVTALVPTGNTKDPVIETLYYNLQGQKIQQPLHNEIYIEKKIHVSGKVEATKILFKNNRKANHS